MTILVLEGELGLCAEEVRRWRAAGRRVLVARHGDPQRSDDDITLDLTDRAALAALVTELDGSIEVVHALVSPSPTDLAAVEAAHRTVLLPLLHFAAILGNRWLAGGCALHVLTVGAVDTGTGGGPAALTGGPLVGFALSLRYEFPALRVSATDLETGAPDEVRTALGRTDDRGLLALRASTLLERVIDPVTDGEPVGSGLPAGGVHVITGGLGGVGRHLVTALRRSTGVPIALIQRSAPDPAAMRQWSGAGRTVAYSADVTDRAELESALARIRAELGPIHAVVHAAGVLADGVAKTKTADDLTQVLAPKVRGTWLLDDLTQHDPVEVFIVLSSTVSLYGSLGQSDYAAANAFLDAFAAWRSNSRPGLTQALNLSMWADTGMARGLSADAGAMRAEVVALQPELAADTVLEASLLVDSQIVIERRVRTASRYPMLEPRRALPPTAVSSGIASGQPVLAKIVEVLNRLGVDSRGRTDEDFFTLGLDSAALLELASTLSGDLSVELYPTLLFEFPTPSALAGHLADRHPAVLVPVVAKPAAVDPDAIAIVGYSYRFPGGADFWSTVVSGKTVLAPGADLPYRSGRAVPDGPVAGLLDDVTRFDPLAFKISPRDAALVDPQHRLALECSRHALEHAGHAGESATTSRTGVFLGVMNSEYETEAVRRGVDLKVSTGTSRAILANSVSYALDLRGPSMPVETACSSSLVAVHLAAQALRAGDADMMLAGGVNVLVSPATSDAYSAAGLLSPTGRCRPFDRSADGYVRGEGAGVVVLRRLADAIADGDTIHAVIRGSAVSHSGRSNGLGAPHPQRQAEVIRKALGDMDPNEITYVETHGTGTALGDPVEVRGLVQGLGDAITPCRLSSVKGTIGHLESAAGIASLIKVLHSIEHETIAPIAGLDEANPLLDLGRFELTAERVPWRRGDWPRTAAVSSFGFGGVNAHVILTEPPAGRRETTPGPRLILLSAHTPTALRTLRDDIADHLANHPDLDIADIAFTLAAGRPHLQSRLAVVASTVDELRFALVRPQESTGELAALGAAFERGESGDWTRTSPPANRIPLPGYPFERERYWCFEATGPARILVPRWTTARPETMRATAELSASVRVFVVYAHDVTTAERLARYLVPEGRRCVLVTPADEFTVLAPDRYAIRMNDRDDHRHVVRDLGQGVQLVWALALASDEDNAAIRGVRLCGQLAALHGVARELDQAHLLIMTKGDGGVLGLARVMAQEEPRLAIRVLDVDPDEPLGDSLADALSHQVPGELVQAFRMGTTLVRDLVEYSATAPSATPPTAWWITGGLSGLGLQIARRLAGDHVPIVLTSRRGLPEQSEWAGVLAEQPDSSLAALLRTLASIREQAGELVIASGDVANANDVAKIAGVIRDRFGPEYGIVHAAGVAGTGQRAYRLTEAAFERVFAAKVGGVVHLDEQSRQDAVPAFVVVSSLSALAGGWGFGDYAAANAAMDATVRARHARGLPATILNLTAIQDVGMAADAAVPLPMAISVDAALSVLPLALANVVPQLVVTAAESAEPARPSEKLPVVSTGSTGERFRQLLASTIATAPGLLNPAASLPDLGLDSRAQLAFLDQVEQEFQVDLPLELLGGTTTVAEFTHAIEVRVAENDGADAA
jgi:acyl transferase domain-containing protein/acyl carrier protein